MTSRKLGIITGNVKEGVTGLQNNHSRMDLEVRGLQDRCHQEKDGTDRLPDKLYGTEQDFTPLYFGGFFLHHYLLMTLVKLNG